MKDEFQNGAREYSQRDLQPFQPSIFCLLPHRLWLTFPMTKDAQNPTMSRDENLAQEAPDACGKVPPWAWIFVAACWGVVFFAPAMVIVAAICSFICTNMARDETQPLRVRLARTALTMLVCWLVFAALFFVALHVKVAPPPAAPTPKMTR